MCVAVLDGTENESSPVVTDHAGVMNELLALGTRPRNEVTCRHVGGG